MQSALEQCRPDRDPPVTRPEAIRGMIDAMLHILAKQPGVPVGNSILLATDIESGDAPALCERFVA